MGKDICGWVEEKILDKWVGVLRIDAVVLNPNHYGFGTIFLDNRFFEPIAKNRGLPIDISEQVKLDCPEQDGGHTWAYWYEIEQTDWDEVYSPPSPLIHKWKVNSSGSRTLMWRGYISELDEIPDIDFTQAGETKFDGFLYQVEFEPVVRRRDTLQSGWEIVFDTMKYLSRKIIHDDEGVRIVVWFNG